MAETDQIERRIDKDIVSSILVSQEAGGVDIRKLDQVVTAAQLMARSDSMVPKFLRNNPGGCFGIIWKALAWGLEPFAVASMAYEVINKRTDEKTVAYMSQLSHAIVIRRAPIKEHSLLVRYEGEGDDRVCIVGGTFDNEDAPREHRSPKLGDILARKKPRGRDNRDPRSETVEDDSIAGSPLWRTKPDVQLFYDTSRDWVRIYCPDILMGIYTKEEMEAVGYTTMTPVRETPADDGGLGARLSQSALARVGFPVDQVTAATAEAVANRGGPMPEAQNGPLAAGAAPEAPQAPETGEASQRPSRARRSGKPTDNTAELTRGVDGQEALL